MIDSENGFAAEEGRWLRQLGRVDYPVLQDRLIPFVEVEQERRAQNALGTDSLVADALAFVEVRPGVQWVSPTLTAGAGVEWRDEQLPLGGAFADAATVYTIRTDARFRPSATYTTEAQVAYRTRKYTDAFQREGLLDNESVVLRWTNRWSPLARAVDLNTVYEAQTERSPVLQEIYLLVGQELGEYVWEDANGDGVPQLDEFREEVTPLEGEYLRTFVPGDELIPTIGVQGRVRLRLDPARLFDSDATGWRRALANVTSLTTLDVQEKSEEPDLADVYFLRPSALQDPVTTLNGRFRVGQEFAFFPSETRYGGRLFGQHLRSTNRLATGLERRLVQQAEAEVRGALTGPLTGRLRGSLDRSQSESPFASRRFDIRGVEVEPEATWRFGPALSLTGGVRYARNRDVADVSDERTARILLLPVERPHRRGEPAPTPPARRACRRAPRRPRRGRADGVRADRAARAGRVVPLERERAVQHQPVPPRLAELRGPRARRGARHPQRPRPAQRRVLSVKQSQPVIARSAGTRPVATRQSPDLVCSSGIASLRSQ